MPNSTQLRCIAILSLCKLNKEICNEGKRDLVPLVDAINTSRFAQDAKDYVFLVNVLKLYKFMFFFSV